MCSELLKYLTLIISELGNCIPHMLKEKEEMTEGQEKNKIEKMMKEMINKKEDAERYVKDLRDYRIAALYERAFLPFLITLGLNLGQFNVVRVVDCKLVGQEESRRESFDFRENNGNYVFKQESDLSWMKGKDLYHERVDNKLKETEVGRVAMEKLSLA